MSSCDFRKEQSNDTSPTTDAERDQLAYLAYLCFDITFSSTLLIVFSVIMFRSFSPVCGILTQIWNMAQLCLTKPPIQLV